MKIADTISVNPSKSTLGQVESSTSTIFRSPVIGVQAEQNKIDLSKILFPASNSAFTEYKKYAVPLRTLFSTILIVTGIVMLESSLSAGLAICSICFGAILALGILTRPIMLGASVFYCITGALSIRHGATDLTSFYMMFGCVLFGILGAGKYSCDTLLKGSLRRYRINKENRRKEEMMGYKAFHHVK